MTLFLVWKFDELQLYLRILVLINLVERYIVQSRSTNAITYLNACFGIDEGLVDGRCGDRSKEARDPLGVRRTPKCIALWN